MQLVQARIVTANVARLAGFYAELLGVPTVLNDYYVEVVSGPTSVGFSRSQFTEFAETDSGRRDTGSTIILDFLVDDVDAYVERVEELGADWVLHPTDQPWGARSMVFRDPEGNLINVFARTPSNAGQPHD